jgi:TonB-dependent SusC/RagA subfamily outer membrane receptor
MKNFLTAAALFLALNAWSQQLPKNDASSASSPSRHKELIIHDRRGKEPLYVIDGVTLMEADSAGHLSPAKAMPDLDGNDIESVTVLKDSSATALYGEKGVNGIILITTKHGTRPKKKG